MAILHKIQDLHFRTGMNKAREHKLATYTGTTKPYDFYHWHTVSIPLFASMATCESL